MLRKQKHSTDRSFNKKMMATPTWKALAIPEERSSTYNLGSKEGYIALLTVQEQRSSRAKSILGGERLALKF